MGSSSAAASLTSAGRGAPERVAATTWRSQRGVPGGERERERAATPRNGEEQREHLTEEEPTKHASACVQHSWCTARAGGRVAPDGVHVVS
mmetsp:Transcript_154243/g.493364  ORF Transcript_154243/g.493364 Transcript_154243/m.493364 type:complete len:91 (-) Transcript_154243:1931-2203(-)